ncbi:MAG: PIN domain-containing protein [Anaerolineales bacterium]
MTNPIHKIFLDTSVIIAAVFSETGGARKLLKLGEMGMIQLVVGPRVLRECEDVVRRKVPASLPRLAYLLEIAQVDTTAAAEEEMMDAAKNIVEYRPDAYILAEAMGAKPDWLITHDKEHFLKIRQDAGLPFKVGTPGDFIQSLEEEFLRN